MTQQLHASGLEWQRVGIDFRRAEPGRIADELQRRFPGLRFDLRSQSGAELGCWASHLCAWQRLLASDMTSLTVLEDDLVLAPDFAYCVRAVAASDALDLVYLGTSSRNISQRRRLVVADFSVHAPVGLIFNTWAYTVRRSWVERLFSGAGVIDMPIDHFLGGRARWCRPTVGVVQPMVVAEDPQLGRSSQIGPFTARLDRASIVDEMRRALLGSRLSDLYYRTVYRLL